MRAEGKGEEKTCHEFRERSVRSTCRDLMREGICLLESAGVPDPRVSVEALLSAVLAKPGYVLYLEDDRTLASSKVDTYHELLQARAARHPLQYLVRSVGFRNILLDVGSGCFIPRPETEILVDVVLKNIGQESNCLNVLDIGTGSGNIAISLAKECGRSFVMANDISSSALRFARRNTERNGVSERVRLVQTDLCHGIADARLDVIVSNPPYLSEAEMSSLQPEVSYEPSLALDGGWDGLAFFRRMVPEASRVLKHGGFVAFEIGIAQAEAVANMLNESGFESIEVVKDHSGIDRIISAAKS